MNEFTSWIAVDVGWAWRINFIQRNCSMNEPEIVTTQNPKNPGRQEWGRKLGKMSKQLKLEKENKKLKDNWKIKWEYLFGSAAVVIEITALYYQTKSYNVQFVQNKEHQKKIVWWNVYGAYVTAEYEVPKFKIGETVRIVKF